MNSKLPVRKRKVCLQSEPILHIYLWTCSKSEYDDHSGLCSRVVRFAPWIFEATAIINLPFNRLPVAGRAPVYRSIRKLVSADHADVLAARPAAACIFAAAIVAMLYRYTGQNEFPLLVKSDPASDLRMPAGATVSGRDSILDITRRMCSVNVFEECNQAFAGGDRISIALERPEFTSGGVENESIVALDFCAGADECGLDLMVLFDCTLFDQAIIDQILTHLARIVRLASDQPGTLVRDLAFFDETESRTLEELLTGPTCSNHFTPIIEQFEDCARKYPEKSAVEFSGESLSYQTVNRRANQFARFLLDSGIEKGAFVAVCLQPCHDVVITLLALHKCGASYVPINPEHPRERIRLILEDTAAKHIVTTSDIDVIPAEIVPNRVNVDQLSQLLRSFPAHDLGRQVFGNDIAYVYFTSGTTGTPKGVLTTHANMSHFIGIARDRYQIDTNVRIPAVASYTFSISMFEIMSPLSIGGTLILLSRSDVMDAETMAVLLQTVSMFHIGPSLLKNILRFIRDQKIDPSKYDNVKHASSGGDMVTPEVANGLRQTFQQAEVFVIYGCSEISLMGCTWEIEADHVERTYVGMPFAGMRLHILDDDDNQVPIGAVGDVCFSGNGIVSGYMNRPDLEKSLFVNIDGNRCYRTGDRGRLDQLGRLELLGRRDFQVQLRGMRIELAEIDYHLRSAPHVKDGVVASQQRPDGEQFLVGYYVATDGNAVSAESLRTHLLTHLPDYMVPAYFVELDALPLNPNLKIDRLALAPLTLETRLIEYPPETATERELAAMWCSLLNQTDVGLEDNFMALGGDSLLAMQFMQDITRRFNCRIDGLEVLREPLAILASLVDKRTGRVGQNSRRCKRDLHNPILPIESKYFGQNQSLYGLFHKVSGADAEIPVLICPTLPHNYIRLRYFLRMLSEALAVEDIPSFRFDYFGTGDSLGSDAGISFKRWKADIISAADELRAQTGQKLIQVFAYGVNALMALQALAKEDIHRWVLWDPIIAGQIQYEEMRRLYEETARSLFAVRNFRFPHQPSGWEQLVGAMYPVSTIQELQTMSLTDLDFRTDEKLVQILSSDYKSMHGADGLRSAALGDENLIVVSEESRPTDTTRAIKASTHQSIINACRSAFRSGTQ